MSPSHEDLARLLVATHVAEAKQRRREHLLRRAQRLSRRDARAAERARVAAARIL